jgi:hypothetical protein
LDRSRKPFGSLNACELPDCNTFAVAVFTHIYGVYFYRKSRDHSDPTRPLTIPAPPFCRSSCPV